MSQVDKVRPDLPQVRRVLAALLVASAVIFPTNPAGAADDFAVSLPAEPLVAQPGQTLDVSMRVVNRSTEKRSFKVKAVSLVSEDQGKVRVAEADEWASGLSAPSTVDVEALNYTEVPVKLAVPTTATVDIYLVGLAVEPVKAAVRDQVEVRNQAVNHISVEIPGNAVRAVAIKNHKLPKIIFGNELSGSFDVENTGEAGVRFRSQAYINSRFGNENIAVERTESGATAELLPKGRVKTESYKWKAKGLASAIRPTAEVNYSDGSAGMKAIRSEGPTVIFLPIATVVGVATIIALVLLTVLFIVVKRRIKARRSRPSEQKVRRC